MEALEPAITSKDYLEAHSQAEEIRKIFSDLLKKPPDSDVQQMLDNEQEIFKEYLIQEEERKENKLQTQLTDIKSQIEDAFSQKAFTSIEELLIQLQDLASKSVREPIRNDTEQYVIDVQSRKNEAQRIEHEREIIQDKIQAAESLTTKTTFDDAIEKLNEALNIAQNDQISDLSQTIQDSDRSNQ